MTIVVRDCAETDLPAILDIHNDAVRQSTAIWTYGEADLANRLTLLAERRAKNYPYIVAEEAGAVVGYAYFSDFRSGEGYHRTVEHSVYVRQDRRGRGIAKLLLPRLIAAGKELGKHVMIGGIEATNAASIRLHQTFGFVETGRLREVGFKFDRYLDLVFMQKILQ
ncbi:MAG: N-acetyltransferase [Methylobacteriaceae bacterium]|nr:N-acetyltransferase [Methylobacteriaceae bacterium]